MTDNTASNNNNNNNNKNSYTAKNNNLTHQLSTITSNSNATNTPDVPSSLRNMFQPIMRSDTSLISDPLSPEISSTSLEPLATPADIQISIDSIDDGDDDDIDDSRSHIVRSNLSLYESNMDTQNYYSTASYLSSHSWDPQRAAALLGHTNGKQHSHNMTGQAASINTGINIGVPTSASRISLGTVKGVLVPCLQNIFGVILFVRLPWITGMAGVGLTLIIVFMAVACTILTTLSMSAIATNGVVPAGGAYYMISRSLGKEYGVSVGVLFYAATAIGVAMYVLGAVEILVQTMVPQISIGDSANDSRVYGTVLLVLITAVGYFGIKQMNRFAIVFFFLVCIAITSVIAGLLSSNRSGFSSKEVIGFPGDLGDNFYSGLGKPDLSGAVNPSRITFFTLFAIFFPSVTGIMAGSNRSGDLKNVSKAIPRGTLGAIAISTTIYLIFILLFGVVCTGPFLRTKIPDEGLHVSIISWPHPLVVLIGTFLSSIGAALQGLAGGPRLVQAVANDGIIPVLSFFQKVHNGEPRRALLLTYVIAQAAVLIGSLDAVAPITTMLFLICYAFVNASTALLGFLQYPNWRPTWRYYHWSVSLFGALLCVVYMFLINYIFALVALAVVLIMYKYIEYCGAKVEWGDGMYGLHMNVAQKNLLALERRNHIHVKNWRPQLMCLVDVDLSTHLPSNPGLLMFLAHLRKAGGLSIVMSALPGELIEKSANKELVEYRDILSMLMKEYGIDGFSQVMVSPDVNTAKLAALQSIGLGAMRPNSILLEYPTNWREQSQLHRDGFLYLLRHIIANDKVTVLLKADNPDHPYPLRGSKPFSPSHTIDVYWIMHDGGILTMLPHILRKHRVWRKTKLRIFCVAQEQDDSVQMGKDLRVLLAKFRIDAEALIVEMGSMDITEFTYEKTIRMQERNELLTELNTSQANLMALSPSMLNLPAMRRRKPDKHKAEFMNTSVKLNAVIKEHSTKAAMIFCNLPAPTKKQSSSDYLEYLDALTADLPRVALIKGTGMEVVTAYC